MKCPSCNAVILKNANFCHNCGISLQPVKDRVRIPAYNIFEKTNSQVTEALKRLMPASYVEKLLASDGKYEGERRIVTMLFSDIKGSTSMGENLDPEEVMEIMNKAFEVLIKPIMRYEGTIARLMGDAILAFFGAPIAHEDDPQRACRAALDIIKSSEVFSKKLKEEKGIESFSVRVGINTGLVVVAEVGADLRVEYTAMGDAVNVAARMETAADPGTIFITEDTVKLLPDSFEVNAVGPIHVKGRLNPVSTYRLLSENRSLSYKKNKWPILGRKEEIQSILESFRELSEGKGKIISVIGECGTGKTRLLSEIQSLVSSQVLWMESKALAYRKNNSYWLVKNLLRSCPAEADLSPENLKKTLKKGKNFKLSEAFTFISYLLDLDTEDRHLSDCDMNDAETLKGQIQYAVKEYIKFLSEENPVVLLLEDLQWCDTLSLEIIMELFTLVAENRIILLMTYRINNGQIWNIHSSHLNNYARYFQPFLLNALGERESRELIRILAGNLTIPETLEAEIVKRSDGNPFFIEEVLKSFICRKLYLADEESCYTEIRNEFNTPNLLHGVIMARIDCLSQVDKMVLQSASVIGRIFQKRLLADILINSLNDKEIEESLNELIWREFIEINTTENFILDQVNSEETFSFKQSLIQEVAYNSLLISAREKIHLSAAVCIEKLYPKGKNSIADSLGVHFEKGKNLADAVAYYKIAADKSKCLFANNEAIHFYKKILTLSEHRIIDKKVLFEIHESLGDIYSLISQYSNALSEYETALTMTESDINRGIIHLKCGQAYERWGEYVPAVNSYNCSMEYIRHNKNVTLEARVLIGMGMVYYREERFDESLYYSSQAKELLKNNENSFELSEAYNNIGIIYAKTGDLERSEEYLLKSLEIRKIIGSSSGLSSSYNNLGFVYQLKGELDRSEENYLHGLKLCERTGNKHGLAKTYDNLSNIYLNKGESEKAIEYNLKAMEILGKITFNGQDVRQHIWLQSGVW